MSKSTTPIVMLVAVLVAVSAHALIVPEEMLEFQQALNSLTDEDVHNVRFFISQMIFDQVRDREGEAPTEFNNEELRMIDTSDIHKFPLAWRIEYGDPVPRDKVEQMYDLYVFGPCRKIEQILREPGERYRETGDDALLYGLKYLDTCATILGEAESLLNEVTLRRRPTDEDQGEQSELDQGEQSELDQGEQSALNQGNQSELDLGEQSELDLGEQSELDLGEQSALNQGNQSELGLGEQSELDLGEQPALNLGNQSELDQGEQSALDEAIEQDLDVEGATSEESGAELSAAAIAAAQSELPVPVWLGAANATMPTPAASPSPLVSLANATAPTPDNSTAATPFVTDA